MLNIWKLKSEHQVESKFRWFLFQRGLLNHSGGRTQITFWTHMIFYAI